MIYFFHFHFSDVFWAGKYSLTFFCASRTQMADAFLQRVKGNVLALCKGDQSVYKRIRSFMLEHGDGSSFKITDTATLLNISDNRKFCLFVEHDISTPQTANFLMGTHNGTHFAYYTLEELAAHDFKNSLLDKRYCRTAYAISAAHGVSEAQDPGKETEINPCTPSLAPERPLCAGDGASGGVAVSGQRKKSQGNDDDYMFKLLKFPKYSDDTSATIVEGNIIKYNDKKKSCKIILDDEAGVLNLPLEKIYSIINQYNFFAAAGFIRSICAVLVKNKSPCVVDTPVCSTSNYNFVLIATTSEFNKTGFTFDGEKIGESIIINKHNFEKNCADLDLEVIAQDQNKNVYVKYRYCLFDENVHLASPVFVQWFAKLSEKQFNKLVKTSPYFAQMKQQFKDEYGRCHCFFFPKFKDMENRQEDLNNYTEFNVLDVWHNSFLDYIVLDTKK